ncbi:non-homologous end-joining DNA ligase [Pendulispora brunnea]|uniref:DNA ligase (ATP) n=1 Tax=Pendulispora brunnea TaxID=2905690 RepID=A0ABZ2K619_9BACT
MRRPPARTAKVSPGNAEALAHLLGAVPPEPQLATLAESVPSPSRWRYELKFDGYRILAYCDRGHILLMSRRALDWTGEFPEVANALRALRLPASVLDGEVCAVDEGGIPRFNLLQNRAGGARLVYVAFDLLWRREDLRRAPLEERRRALEKLVGHDAASTVFASTSAEGDPREILRLACRAGYEGIVAKQQGSLYSPGRSRTWLKLKCSKRQEFGVIGYVPMVGGKVVGALLLAVREGDRLVYAGRTGTGFTTAQRAELARGLDRHRVEEPPAADVPRDVLSTAIWSKPRLVVEVAYLERTKGELRHSSFKGIRADKTPMDCTWEISDPNANPS